MNSRAMLATLTRKALRSANVRELRTMREWAEQEYWVEGGAAVGRFEVATNPWTGFWLDAIDSGLFQEHYLTGKVQAGKTLLGMNIPCGYHLFEVGETVILGAPTIEMAFDKWIQDIKPMIKASRYAKLLPQSGAGSKDGKALSIRFGNGATLKFMGAGGGDANKSGFTSRVVVLTELDKMDESREASREADPVSQMIARTSSYGARRRIYGECTTSIAEGRINQMMLKGTGTRLALPCHTCGEHQIMERRHLVGWQDAASDLEAGEKSAWICEHCGSVWNQAQRHAANANALMVHRTQRVENGQVVGEAPRTKIFSFRFNAGNDMLPGSSPEVAGAKEWSLEQSVDTESADKERSQFLWAEPFVPAAELEAPLAMETLLHRGSGYGRGVLPPGIVRIVRGADVGMHLIHWADVALLESGLYAVTQFGVVETKAKELGVESGVALALDEMAETDPDLMLVDSRYCQKQVFDHCRGNKGRHAVQGLGDGTFKMPKQKGPIDLFLGENYYIRLQKADRIRTFNLDSDHWKRQVHIRLSAPMQSKNALLLPTGRKDELFTFIMHLTAEKWVEEFKENKGRVAGWQKTRANHWLDTVAYAMAGHSLAAAMGKARKPPPPPKAPKQKTEAQPQPQAKPVTQKRRRDGGW